MPRATNRLLGPTRQQGLLNYLRTHRTGHVSELSEMLGASESTIRRDLDELQRQGLVERVHGGAAITEDGGEPAPPLRATAYAQQKRRIGERAATLVEPGSTILISGGTTTEAMLGFLGDRPGLVVTNSLNIGAGLAKLTDCEVVVLGGLLRRDEMSLLGHVTVQTLQEFQVDAVFTGAYGIDPERGLTGMNIGETQTDRALIESAARLVVLADSSKLRQRGSVKLASAETISTLITDDDADDDAVRVLREKGVEVITC